MFLKSAIGIFNSDLTLTLKIKKTVKDLVYYTMIEELIVDLNRTR